MTVGKQERDVTDNKMLSVIPVAGICKHSIFRLDTHVP